ncbi:hypothetical protein B0H12DRAFT_1076130 [Mycena haematopus]|nr:hypothetical protein B0H12DRAFT_1076130 [Mycena haematopus]
MGSQEAQNVMPIGSHIGVGVAQEGLLRRFGLEFKAEVAKLFKAPALITNVEAVEKYLQTVEARFARAIQLQFQTSVLLSEGAFPRLISMSSTEHIALGTREDDPIELRDLIFLAETMAAKSTKLTSPNIALVEPTARKHVESNKGTQKSEQLVQAQPRGLIPIRAVFGVEFDSEDVSEQNPLSVPWNRSLGAVESYSLDSLDENENDFDWVEIAQDRIRTLKSQLARLQNQNSGLTSWNGL